MDEMDQAVKEFANPNADKPVVLEIFTEKERDVQILKGYRRLIHQAAFFRLAAKKLRFNRSFF